MRRQHRIDEMMKMARELAGHGHRPQMIEALLIANGFPEAAEFIDQPHMVRQLTDLAHQARQGEKTEESIEDNAG